MLIAHQGCRTDYACLVILSVRTFWCLLKSAHFFVLLPISARLVRWYQHCQYSTCNSIFCVVSWWMQADVPNQFYSHPLPPSILVDVYLINCRCSKKSIASDQSQLCLLPCCSCSLNFTLSYTLNLSIPSESYPFVMPKLVLLCTLLSAMNPSNAVKIWLDKKRHSSFHVLFRLSVLWEIAQNKETWEAKDNNKGFRDPPPLFFRWLDNMK